MISKKKICSSCGNEQFIWKNSGGKRFCKECWYRENPPKKLVATTTIKKVSKKRQKENLEYFKVKEEYFKEHPYCEFPGCRSKEITLHHKKGRIGSFLTDKRYFCSLCWEHHLWIETHPEQARQLGLSLKRNEND
jgi:hypothetical protein